VKFSPSRSTTSDLMVQCRRRDSMSDYSSRRKDSTGGKRCWPERRGRSRRRMTGPIHRLYELYENTGTTPRLELNRRSRSIHNEHGGTLPCRTAMEVPPQASREVGHRVRGRRRDRAWVVRDRRRRRAVRSRRDRRRLGQDEVRRRRRALLPGIISGQTTCTAVHRGRTSVPTTSVDVVPGSAGVGVHHSYVVGGTPEMLYSVAVSVSLAAPSGASGAARRGGRTRTCSVSRRVRSL
jgi:hypothetical protein